MAIEQIEHVRCHGGIRAVVEGERDATLGRGRERHQVRAEQGPAGDQAGDGQRDVIAGDEAERPGPLGRGDDERRGGERVQPGRGGDQR